MALPLPLPLDQFRDFSVALFFSPIFYVPVFLSSLSLSLFLFGDLGLTRVSFYILGLYFGDFNLSSTFLNIMIRAEHSRLKKTSEITISKVSWLKNVRG